MSFFQSKQNSSILTAFEKAKIWIQNNTVQGGIAHSSSLQKPYPEVTGYYIPSLLEWGEKERACQYGDWLISIQTPEGAWQEPELITIYTFDTGQILKGLYCLSSLDEKYEKAFIKGCDWLLTQIDAEGRVLTPTTAHFSTIGSEYIHLYALEPLKLAAEKYQRKDYTKGVERAIKYYLAKDDLTDFKILSHFHAYIVEALIDLGYPERALQALQDLKQYQRADDIIPAFDNVRWVCLTAVLQYAVCYYKLGMLEEGNKLLDYAISKQNKSGGFFGGYGWFVTYFKNTEISWPVKYLLDAIYLRLKLEFSDNNRAESFLLSIDARDQRYRLLNDIVRDISSRSQVKSSQVKSSQVKFLDVGCGKGRFIHRILSEGFPVEITALDISDKLFKYLPDNCQKTVGNICAMPLENELYDIVFCCEVLEHAVNIQGAVQELSRVCKPGGTVIVMDKDLTRQKNISLEIWEQWFDKEYLTDLMRGSNLIVEVRELLTTDGPPICAWIGKKSINA